jgi:predicted ATP-grasp superfamily ATP-dependent carboligase
VTDRTGRRLRRDLARALWPPAVVLDVSFVNGLAAIRSLARTGAPVIAVDHRPGALGFRSRLAHPVLSPDPEADEEAYVEFLGRLADEHFSEPAVVFPTHDAALRAVAAHADRLGGYQLPGSGWDVLEPLQRKRHQLEAAERAGVGVPRTRYPAGEEEARAAGREMGFPVAVKPSEPLAFKRRLRRPAIVCRSEDELAEAFALAAGSMPMVQEIVPGDDDTLWTAGTYVAADGAPLGVFCGRKLLQMPRGFGTCRLGEARWRDDVVEQALAVLRELGHRGIAQTEFRLDERDSRLKLMEVNPRLWQWHSLAAACGVDIPAIAYADALGRPPQPVRSGPDCDGRRWVALAAHLRATRAEGGSATSALRSLGDGTVEATLDWRDPLPAAVSGAGVVTAPVLRSARGLMRRFRP